MRLWREGIFDSGTSEHTNRNSDAMLVRRLESLPLHLCNRNVMFPSCLMGIANGRMSNLKTKRLRSLVKTNITCFYILDFSADDDFDGTFHTNVICNFDGSCKWLPPGMFKSTCQIDIRWFPFDEQRCILKFGSWTYDGRYLNLVFDDKEEGDTSDFIRNGEWDLIGKSNRQECWHSIPFVDVRYNVLGPVVKKFIRLHRYDTSICKWNANKLALSFEACLEVYDLLLILLYTETHSRKTENMV